MAQVAGGGGRRMFCGGEVGRDGVVVEGRVEVGALVEGDVWWWCEDEEGVEGAEDAVLRRMQNLPLLLIGMDC